jgi:hypothetical protein
MDDIENEAPNNSSVSCVLIHIRWRDNFLFTVTLPNKDKVIHIQIRRLDGGIYYVRLWGGLMYRDIRIYQVS